MGPGKSGHPTVIQYAQACLEAGVYMKFHCPTCGQPQHPDLNGEACARFIALAKSTVRVRFVATTHPEGGFQEVDNQEILTINMTRSEANDPDHLRTVVMRSPLFNDAEVATKLESSHYLVADMLGAAGTITETLILFRPHV